MTATRGGAADGDKCSAVVSRVTAPVFGVGEALAIVAAIVVLLPFSRPDEHSAAF